MPQTLYTVKQVARMMDVGDATIYGLLKTGDLKGTVVGKQFRITPEALRAYLELSKTAEIIIPPEQKRAEAPG